jgi:hypothetical protein
LILSARHFAGHPFQMNHLPWIAYHFMMMDLVDQIHICLGGLQQFQMHFPQGLDGGLIHDVGYLHHNYKNQPAKKKCGFP